MSHMAAQTTGNSTVCWVKRGQFLHENFHSISDLIDDNLLRSPSHGSQIVQLLSWSSFQNMIKAWNFPHLQSFVCWIQ